MMYKNDEFAFLKLRCDDRFMHAFTACGCVLKDITLVGLNQGNFFENATACSKRMRKTTVATQLKKHFCHKLFSFKKIKGQFYKTLYMLYKFIQLHICFMIFTSVVATERFTDLGKLNFLMGVWF